MIDNKQLLIKETPNGIVFKIFVQPRSSKNMIVGLYGDSIKIKLTAPPVDGAANKMCVKFLAKILGMSKSSIKIISGFSSRTKQVLITDFSKDNYHIKKHIILSMLNKK
ncbi:conserved hypothetical protein [Candidatus Magnetomoraceae bacterium gMMP-15]